MRAQSLRYQGNHRVGWDRSGLFCSYASPSRLNDRADIGSDKGQKIDNVADVRRIFLCNRVFGPFNLLVINEKNII